MSVRRSARVRQMHSPTAPPPSPAARKRRKISTEPVVTSPPLTPHTSAIGCTGGTLLLRPSLGRDSPSGTPATTCHTMLDDACRHLISVDERLRPVIAQHHCRMFSPEGLAEPVDPFRSLSSGIMAQQVSGAAAKRIQARFVALFPPESRPTGFPPPRLVATTDLATLRTAGLSQRKAEYIRGLAQKFDAGDISAATLMRAPDEQVMRTLVAVRGLGAWSVEMFMCFGLKRIDVFSTGDLGVQRGMAALVGRDVARRKANGRGKWKYMSEEDMVRISDPFRPYRSVFMWYMWRMEHVNVDAVQHTGFP